CDEWPVLTTGSVLVLAKHTIDAVNANVFLEDMANTIDGGVNASNTSKKNAIIYYDEHGGQFVVQANTSNPAYQTETYKASGNKPQDILMTIVKGP
ncbi:hypothetical protein GQ53DRAFT_672898, partial [Thozetella sp. PMI_491]